MAIDSSKKASYAPNFEHHVIIARYKIVTYGVYSQFMVLLSRGFTTLLENVSYELV